MSSTQQRDGYDIAVIGLGYVGWPLARAFSAHVRVLAYDHNSTRVHQLADSDSSQSLTITDDSELLKKTRTYVIAVPTPVDLNRNPDLASLDLALDLVARSLSHGDLVIIESTLYPGCCEDYCAPRLEQISGLELNNGFSLAYCPERLNPGDPDHQLAEVTKVISASNPKALESVRAIYGQITQSSVVAVSSLRVAEAAKIIENTQRDLNIALMNELSMIFRRLDIDTEEVLDAAATKWNFHRYQPGLVGGHCIGVDPYYLTHKALRLGHQPDIVLAGRHINDSMSEYIAGRTLKLMTARGIEMVHARILVMGVTYKEDHVDARNSQVSDLIRELNSYGALVDIYDPVADPETVDAGHRNRLIEEPETGQYDAIVIAVAHQAFIELGAEHIHQLGKPVHVVFDVKWCLPQHQSDERL